MKTASTAPYYHKRIVQVIEQTFESFGIIMRIVEIKEEEKYTLYLAELALGTPLDDVISKDKDIAMATASLNGKCEIIAPVPGTYLFAIKLPYSKEQAEKESKRYEEIKKDAEKIVEDTKEKDNNTEVKVGIKEFFALFFYMFSDVFRIIGDYIMGRRKEKLEE